MGWATVILSLVKGWFVKGEVKLPGEAKPIASWPMILMAISTTGIWVTMTVVGFRQVEETTPTVITQMDTTCQSKYGALQEKYLILANKYADTQDSLLYERNLRLTPPAAAGAIERRYNRK